MKILKILQIREDAPNPVTHLSGYEPTTDYWVKCIRMVNAMLEAMAQAEPSKKLAREGCDVLIEKEIFPDEMPHTAVEWAEFVMALNHTLWVLDSAPKEDKWVQLAMEVFNDLYYAWHDKALTLLKGDDLSTYLRITD
jgi:hypothetical protein